MRVSRVAVPSIMVGVLGLGVAAATWPGDDPQTAYPAPAVSQPLAAVDSPTASREPNMRRTASPSPSAKSSATRKASTKAKPKSKATAKPEVTAKAKPVAKPKPKPAPTPELEVIDTKYVTASLNVRTAPNFESDVVDVVSSGEKVSVTKAIYNGFRYISYNDRGRWISNKYLSDSKPVVQSTGGGSTSSGGGISSASCSKSSSIESGLVPNAIKVYRAICDRYPQVSSFGGRRPGDSGFHGSGRAVDVMIANSSVGWDIANWTRANASRLRVSEVIYYQKIWTVERSSEGWRPMSDRGSPSANHYDHVHVSVY
ncbi:MAG TPA: SH3 domain-containing protein [Propionibacteriaceae bacterium]|nr:SH3 domain-containing protein [Propionibacteriaceae bacterium]